MVVYKGHFTGIWQYGVHTVGIKFTKSDSIGDERIAINEDTLFGYDDGDHDLQGSPLQHITYENKKAWIDSLMSATPSGLGIFLTAAAYISGNPYLGAVSTLYSITTGLMTFYYAYGIIVNEAYEGYWDNDCSDNTVFAAYPTVILTEESDEYVTVSGYFGYRLVWNCIVNKGDNLLTVRAYLKFGKVRECPWTHGYYIDPTILYHLNIDLYVYAFFIS